MPSINNEQELLRAILRPELTSAKEVIVGNGDDAAVLNFGGELIVVTTDNFVEGLDFSRDFAEPEQIGVRAIEASASDVVAMGGLPRFCLVSLSVPKDTSAEFISKIYTGMYDSLDRLSARLVGGDTTAGAAELSLNVTVLGQIRPPSRVCRRSGARAGDLLFVSGNVGSAAAGLAALKNNIPGFNDIKIFHRAPRCRIDLVAQVGPFASSMIDISDGLAHEIHLVCEASNVGCVIDLEKIPFAPRIKEVATLTNCTHFEWVFGGGDDYELLYTVPAPLRTRVPGVEIGVINEERAILINENGSKTALQKLGYDHLKSR